MLLVEGWVDRGRKKEQVLCTCVGKDDVGDCAEAPVEVRRDYEIHFAIAGSFDSDADHGDKYGGQDGDEACNRHVANILHRPWQREDETSDHPHQAEHNGATSVRGDGIHHDGKCEDVAAHGEDQEEDLGGPEDLSSYSSGHDFACVGHVVDVGVGEFELAKYVTSIGCDDAEA